MKSPCGFAAACAAVLLVLLVPAVAGAAVPVGQETGYLQINSTPPGAMVFVNQVRMEGLTPVTIRVPANEPQSVVVQLLGYNAALQTVTVRANETVPLQFKLTLVSSTPEIETATPGGAGTPGPGGETPSGAQTPQEIWTEEAPLPASLALVALAGAGLVAARRRR